MAEPLSRGRPLEPHETKLLKQLGRVIGKHAAKRKISIEKLAYEAGVSKGYLYDIVKGLGNPSITILYRLSLALNITLQELLKSY